MNSNVETPVDTLQILASSQKTRRAMLVDAGASVVGAVLGTSTTTVYLESSIGIHVGGRTGIASIVSGSLFLVSVFVYPIVSIVPLEATGPALILTAINLFPITRFLNWTNVPELTPAIFAAIYIPYVQSIVVGAAVSCVILLLVKIGTASKFKLSYDWVVSAGIFVMSMMVITSHFTFHKLI
eukprot:TRINITY_DN11181_c0_g1_i2.p1 TRINITY_DN11181_c0_g1~~TRINITY_DN11181_c0_g1_i2.p1  ORF type:complete len:197 (+),score=12.60 TRINITY_DN11181_c0_g1_i2:43-591(+)